MDVLVDTNKKNIKFGNVSLKKITIEDIETIRHWRNSERVRKTMVYKEIITPIQQLNWFSSLNEKTDYYFLIRFNDEAIGLVNLKNVNDSDAEAGVFIGNEYFDGKGYGFVAVFLINFFAFSELNLNKLVATILDDNKPAIRFNKSLGYALEKSENGVGKYFLFKETFYQKYSNFKNIASRVV